MKENIIIGQIPYTEHYYGYCWLVKTKDNNYCIAVDNWNNVKYFDEKEVIPKEIGEILEKWIKKEIS